MNPFFSGETKKAGIPITLILFSLALLFLVVKPLFDKVMSIRGETQKLSRANSVLENKVLSLENIDNSSLEKEFRLATAAVPYQIPLFSYVPAIRSAAENSGVVITNLSVDLDNNESDKKNKKEGSQGLTFNVSLEGPVDSIMSFLNNLESSLPLASVDSGYFSQSDVNSGFGVQIVVYWKKLPDSLPKIDEPLATLSDQEKKLLTEISGYKGAETVLLPGSGGQESFPPPSNRDNPFTF